MNTTNQQVHSTTFAEFPRETQQRVESAIANRRVHPQTRGARAEPVQPQQAAPANQASPRVQQRQQAHYGQSTGQSSPRHPVADQGGPSVDPSLEALVRAQVPQQEPQWFETPRPTAAPVGGPQVQNPMPGYVVPLADKDGTSVALPSRFAFYDFKDLYVVPFRNGHLAKLQRAHTEKSLQPVVEVVSTVIYSSDPQYKNLAFDLTMPDFFFVLYWLRMNSFTKMSFVHKDVCRSEKHIQMVNNKQADVESMVMKKIVDRTQIVTYELEQIPDPAVFDLGPDSPYVISPPRMRDVLEYLDHPMMADANTRVEFSWLAQQAAHLQLRPEFAAQGERASLDERIEYVENLDLDKVELIKTFEKMLKGYGVQESINMTCKVCGASKKSSLSLDASSFLSFD